jgi:hypothetical protein
MSVRFEDCQLYHKLSAVAMRCLQWRLYPNFAYFFSNWGARYTCKCAFEEINIYTTEFQKRKRTTPMSVILNFWVLHFDIQIPVWQEKSQL